MISGTPTPDLVDRLDALVCDLDGVVYRGSEPIPGARDAIASLRDRRIALLFCTNNSRFTVAQQVDRLSGFGVDVSADEVLTSAIVTAEVLAAGNDRIGSAIVVGGDGLRGALRDAGIEVIDDDSIATADAVAVGWDVDFDYASMRRAADAVRAGAVFVASNDDATYPAPDGLWPGAGSILASIETASGRRAQVMGKPHPPMLDAIARRLGTARNVAIVGDRPETDLAGAAARGWTSVLVLSGVTEPDAARSVTPPPDIVLGSIAELVAQ